ncbi:hypothetical protein Scep_009928 [Stephania cephalantha]|uniref:Uncharacterized protein n=1 Tax=Stephania cephalantha TaxID=152367 RepID=A0AAP0JU51_9MAGN
MIWEPVVPKYFDQGSITNFPFALLNQLWLRRHYTLPNVTRVSSHPCFNIF